DKDLESTSIRISIKSEDAWSWLSGLNDIRLALAVRLEIGGTTMGDLPSDSHRSDARNKDREASEIQEEVHRKYEVMTDGDPMKAVYAVYNWLGWLQEEFLKQMDPEVQSESTTGD
ncbi:MAG: DUF2017 family protein, partial [Actinobacteria bacterium]|nr:DUF2017 family protein [Actinomycetota bacterium]